MEFLGEKLQTLKAICVEKQRIRATIDEVLELKVKSAANASNQSKSNWLIYFVYNFRKKSKIIDFFIILLLYFKK